MFGYGSKYLSVYFKIRVCLQICAANELYQVQYKIFKTIHNSGNIQSPKEIILVSK